MKTAHRTHSCSILRATDIGAAVTLIGWVRSNRDHGGVQFVDLGDRDGHSQIVFRPHQLSEEVMELARHLRDQDVIQIEGEVAARLEGTVNESLPTGEIEVIAKELRVINKAEVLPFPLDRETGEDHRLEYRYLDLRRERMRRNLATRHRITQIVRNYLDQNDFLEIETPILSKSTPEGARDFLVPSRLNPCSFYALPQAPQQYKQLLMVGGLERYFQIARCFRDEDLRADRQPEFTQIDIEASFIDQEDIITLVETLLAQIFSSIRGVSVQTPFLRLTWDEAMNRYGSDKPDTRFGNELVELTEVFRNSEFKVFAQAAQTEGSCIKAINAKGFADITTGQINRLTELAQSHGAKGLAFIKVEDGEWKSPIVKFFSEAEKQALTQALSIDEGDLILFGAGPWRTVVDVLGRVRLDCAALQGTVKGSDALNFLWVTEFPLLEYDKEEGRWAAVHHPFTRPLASDEDALRAGKLSGELRAQAYDVVLNGHELGGGSIRIHEAELQQAMFSALGIDETVQQSQFGHILRAFSFGAPPHGGIALGLDRLAMLACREDSIREVIAFPKNNRGQDLMSQSPASVELRQLRDLRLSVHRSPEPRSVEERSLPA